MAEHVIQSWSGRSIGRIRNDMRQHVPPEALEAILIEHPTPEAALAQLIQRAIDASEMRAVDPRTVASLFVGMAMDLGHSTQHGVREIQPADARIMVDVLLHGTASGGPREKERKRFLHLLGPRPLAQ